jgi:glycosyltransferase involved in cell wall biosynthesis
VIATDIGAPSETVVAPPAPEETTTGWLVPPADAGALAARVADALGLPAPARAGMGARARSRAVTCFSVEVMQQSTLGVYDRLLGTALQARFGSVAAVSAKNPLDRTVSVSLQRP